MCLHLAPAGSELHAQANFKHAFEHGGVTVDVATDADLGRIWMQVLKPAGVLN